MVDSGRDLEARRSSRRYVYATRSDSDVESAIRCALEHTGILGRVKASSRVAVKPNLTYPVFRPGVTTTPEVLRGVVKVLREQTQHLAIVESDGGYGVWRAHDAFAGHGLHALSREFGVDCVNLSEEPTEPIEFDVGQRSQTLLLPRRLVHETDVLVSLPVPKVHAMTYLSLAYKNQWGCVPDAMRLRRHHTFDDAIVAINRVLRPVVVGDGTFFLDHNGPMEGEAVRMEVIIGATDAGVFDRYVSELMGVPWRRVSHLRKAADVGDMPKSLDETVFNVAPAELRRRVFRLRRTPRNWIALAGFHSRFLTRLGYESWFGRVLLHGILYGLVGKPTPLPVGKRE